MVISNLPTLAWLWERTRQMPCVHWRPFFFFFWKKESELLNLQKQASQDDGRYHTLFCAFLFLVPWSLMINSFKDHQRPNSRQWPNTWKSPPLPPNSWNSPPTHYRAHIFPATDTHWLSEMAHTVCGMCFFKINQFTSYLSPCDGNVGGNICERGKASSGRAWDPLTNYSISSMEQGGLNWASYLILRP